MVEINSKTKILNRNYCLTRASDFHKTTPPGTHIRADLTKSKITCHVQSLHSQFSVLILFLLWRMGNEPFEGSKKEMIELDLTLDISALICYLWVFPWDMLLIVMTLQVLMWDLVLTCDLTQHSTWGPTCSRPDKPSLHGCGWPFFQRDPRHR